MNYFKKNKTMTVIVGLLLIINITALITILVQRQDIGRPKPLSQRDDIERTTFFLKQELEFSDRQVEEFMELQKKFISKNEEYRQYIMKAKTELYGSLQGSEIDSLGNKRLLDVIADNTYLIEINTYDYFKKLKALCTVDQMDKFDILMGQILVKIDPGHRPPHERGERPPHEMGERPPHPEGRPGLPPKRK